VQANVIPRAHEAVPLLMLFGAMRLIARDDTILTAALIASTAIIFRQPLHDVLNAIHDVESRLNLDLFPALLLLIVAFSFHQYGKRVEARAAARTAMADAVQARAQAQVLQQLMALSRALTTALELPALRSVLATHLPGIAPNAAFWVLIRKGEQWEVVLHDEAVDVPVDALVETAQRSIEESVPPDPNCLPLRAGGTVVGVLGTARGVTLTESEQRALEAAAAVLAIGIRNMQLFQETRDLSLRDSLTGCFNRSHAIQTLTAELRRVSRTGTPLSVVMFDIDHFKAVNDQHGHLRGDELLAAVGRTLAQTMRASDVRCRYGGDEFLVILPDTPLRGARQVAEVIRRDIAALPFDAGDQRVTISVGVAAARPGDDNGAAVLERVDAALYRAKEGGRNRVAVAPAAVFNDVSVRDGNRIACAG
jgi:diguanylate cyclase (GGDEF)-like protein